MCRRGSTDCSYFNPRSRKGSDEEDADENQKKDQFQSTLPQGERPSVVPTFSRSLPFQSTLPQGERHIKSALASFKAVFQSTLPQGERQYEFGIGDPGDLISIHAPARGATDKYHILATLDLNFNPRSRKGSDDAGICDIWMVKSISIHAPARGATSARRKPARNTDDFNPRSRKGSDKLAAYEDLGYTPISIHAPARGATKNLDRR